MVPKIKHLDHFRIDTLSDGIFSIALTLLGFDLIGVVGKTAESETLNAGLQEHWPVFLSFFLGFFVLYALWYEYHVTSQYVETTTSLVIWQHGMIMLMATLVPFGTSLLGEYINTPEMNWAVFYFGIILFAEKPLSVIFLLVMTRGDKSAFKLKPDAPVSAEEWAKLGITFYSFVTVYGLVSVIVALFAPWIALAMYAGYLATKLNPVGSLQASMLRVSKLAGVKILTD